jgi:FKBP-type peptidyl-prolyl cis-trans isomerase
MAALPLLTDAAYAAQGSLPQAAPAVDAAGRPRAPALKVPAGVDPVLYAFGVLLTRDINGFGLSEQEYKSLMAGFQDGYHQVATPREAQSYIPQILALEQTRIAAAIDGEAKAGQAFIDKVASGQGALKTGNGLVYVPIKQGVGDPPGAQDTALVDLTGRLIDGAVFEHVVATPISINAGGIECLREALPLMRPGGVARIVCPAQLAYGNGGGQMGLVKPGAAVDFEVTLQKVLHPNVTSGKGAAN